MGGGGLNGWYLPPPPPKKKAETSLKKSLNKNYEIMREKNYLGSGEEEGGGQSGVSPVHSQSRPKYPYQRPAFLNLSTADEIQVFIFLNNLT